MANSDRARKLLIRTALATSATIATLIGAQNLAMLDASQFQSSPTPEADGSLTSQPDAVFALPMLEAGGAGTAFASATVPTTLVVQATPDITIMQAVPNIVILRHAGNTAPRITTTSTSNPVVQQPAAPQIVPPAPVVVQQPVTQKSKSSR